MEQFHRDKIRELSENLSQFREAVEVVAVTMETDTDVPTSGFRKNTKVRYIVPSKLQSTYISVFHFS